ncbi:MAG: ABC transporter permease, partial [Anaerolineales bacterium]
MGRYVVMRLLGLVGVMLAVSLVTFVLMHSVPGGPFDTKMGDKPMPQAIKDQINKLYGLDRPLYEQYFIFIKNAARLDFGTSYIYINRKVTDIYLERWPYTIKLAVLTLIFGGTAGLGLGIVAAVKQ